MGYLLKKAMQPDMLQKAWKQICHDKGLWEPGIPPVLDIHKNNIKTIGDLREEVLNKKYSPRPLRIHKVSKADGKDRTICVSYVRDRFVQRAILQVLQPKAEKIFYKNSYGYRPNVGVDMAVARVKEYIRDGYIWLVDADIRRCFDEIPHTRSLRRLWSLTWDLHIHALIKNWVCSLPKKHQVKRHCGLPQGMVLSPLLCNLYLHQMDKTMEQASIPWVRFADDFVLLARSENEANQAHKLAAKTLKQLKLVLHPDKTQVIRSSKRIRFLGKRLPKV